jgi:hypothetical protein
MMSRLALIQQFEQIWRPGVFEIYSGVVRESKYGSVVGLSHDKRTIDHLLHMAYDWLH